MRCSFSCFLLLLLAPGLQAQKEPQTIAVLKGQVLCETGVVPVGLMVELRNREGCGTAELVAPVMADGSFELHGLVAGEYEVRITNARGEIVYQDFAPIRATGQLLHFRLPEQTSAPPPSGTISVQKLLHPISPRAEKEFRRSRKALKAGDNRKSMAHLEKALQIDPSYMEAHNNLGVGYMALDQYEKAAAEFQRTVALDPASAKGYLNLSMALSLLRSYPQAEAAARRAVQLSPQLVRARYALGQILAAQGKNTAEALENLRAAVGEYPKARLMIARVLLSQGATNQAVAELREYLKAGNLEKREEVESWLARLPQSPP